MFRLFQFHTQTMKRVAMRRKRGKRAATSDFVPVPARKKAGTGPGQSKLFAGQFVRNSTMKKSLIFVAVGLSLAASVARAEEARIGVGVGPIGAGVTVGQSHERRTTVIKEREPRDETVVIRKERREPRDKVIIHERD